MKRFILIMALALTLSIMAFAGAIAEDELSVEVKGDQPKMPAGTTLNAVVSGGEAPYSYLWEAGEGENWKSALNEKGEPVETADCVIPACYDWMDGINYRVTVKDAKGAEEQGYFRFDIDYSGVVTAVIAAGKPLLPGQSLAFDKGSMSLSADAKTLTLDAVSITPTDPRIETTAFYCYNKGMKEGEEFSIVLNGENVINGNVDIGIGYPTLIVSEGNDIRFSGSGSLKTKALDGGVQIVNATGLTKIPTVYVDGCNIECVCTNTEENNDSDPFIAACNMELKNGAKIDVSGSGGSGIVVGKRIRGSEQSTGNLVINKGCSVNSVNNYLDHRSSSGDWRPDAIFVADELTIDGGKLTASMPNICTQTQQDTPTWIVSSSTCTVKNGGTIDITGKALGRDNDPSQVSGFSSSGLTIDGAGSKVTCNMDLPNAQIVYAVVADGNVDISNGGTLSIDLNVLKNGGGMQAPEINVKNGSVIIKATCGELSEEEVLAGIYCGRFDVSVDDVGKIDVSATPKSGAGEAITVLKEQRPKTPDDFEVNYKSQMLTLDEEALGGVSQPANASINKFSVNNNGGYTVIETVFDMTKSITSPASAVVIEAAKPLIWLQPIDEVVREGDTATFKTAAHNKVTSYQWRVNESFPGGTWKDIPGADEAEYTTPAVTAAMRSWAWQCVLTNSKGSTESDPAQALEKNYGIIPEMASSGMIYFSTLKEAVAYRENELSDEKDTVIRVLANNDMIGDDVSFSKDVTIESWQGKFAIKRPESSKGDLLTVKNGAKLILRDVTLDGESREALSFVKVEAGGKLSVAKNVTIENNSNRSNTGAINCEGTISFENENFDVYIRNNVGGGLYIPKGGSGDEDNPIGTGVEISGNTAPLGAGINAGEGVKVYVTGAPFVKNNTTANGGSDPSNISIEEPLNIVGNMYYNKVESNSNPVLRVTSVKGAAFGSAIAVNEGELSPSDLSCLYYDGKIDGKSAYVWYSDDEQKAVLKDGVAVPYGSDLYALIKENGDRTYCLMGETVIDDTITLGSGGIAESVKILGQKHTVSRQKDGEFTIFKIVSGGKAEFVGGIYDGNSDYNEGFNKENLFIVDKGGEVIGSDGFEAFNNFMLYEQSRGELNNGSIFNIKGGNVKLTNCDLSVGRTDNTRVAKGGIAYVYDGGSLNVVDCLMDHTSIKGFGGCVAVVNGEFNADKLVLSADASNGGGIYIENPSGKCVLKDVKTQNCAAISNDDGTYAGGAIMLKNCKDLVTIDSLDTSDPERDKDDPYRGNQARDLGASIAVFDDTNLLLKGTINIVQGHMSFERGKGGAIYVDKSSKLILADGADIQIHEAEDPRDNNTRGEARQIVSNVYLEGEGSIELKGSLKPGSLMAIEAVGGKLISDDPTGLVIAKKQSGVMTSDDAKCFTFDGITSDYRMDVNADGALVIVKSAEEVTITKPDGTVTKYTKLQEALKEAKTGDTITLMTDAYLTDGTTISEAITVKGDAAVRKITALTVKAQANLTLTDVNLAGVLSLETENIALKPIGATTSANVKLVKGATIDVSGEASAKKVAKIIVENPEEGLRVLSPESSVTEAIVNQYELDSTEFIIDKTGRLAKKPAPPAVEKLLIKALVIGKGQEIKLRNLLPWDYKGTVSWTSGNASVFKVTDKKVQSAKGIELGDSTLTATFSDGEQTIPVTVIEKGTAVTQVKTVKKLELKPLETKQLAPTVNPAKATDKTLVWISSDSAVATVENGHITARKQGVCRVTAIAQSGARAVIKVTVKRFAKIESYVISETELTLKTGETRKLTATILPAEADQTIKWSSKKPKIASVKDGVITALKPGTANVVVKFANDKKLVCKVTVTD